MGKTFGCTLLLLIHISSAAGNSGVSLLDANGVVWLNGSEVPRCSAVFPGDVVQTPQGGMASIISVGSQVLILADSLAKVEASAFSLDHGSLSIATRTGTVAKVGDVKVVPPSDAWTVFQVRAYDGGVEVVAEKGNVNLTDAAGTTALSPGQRATRKASRKGKRGPTPAARGSVLDSTPVVITGGVAAAGMTTWVLSLGPNPVSPAQPNKSPKLLFALPKL